MHSCYISSALCQLHKWKHKFSPESSGAGLGGDIENGHLNLQQVVVGLLVVK